MKLEDASGEKQPLSGIDVSARFERIPAGEIVLDGKTDEQGRFRAVAPPTPPIDLRHFDVRLRLCGGKIDPISVDGSVRVAAAAEVREQFFSGATARLSHGWLDLEFVQPITNWTVVYRNWTKETARAFHLCIVQAWDEVRIPSLPEAKTGAFVRSSTPMVEALSEGRRRICYSFEEGAVAPGRTIELAVRGPHIETAGGVIAAWARGGAESAAGGGPDSPFAGEIDRTFTDSLMGRRSFTVEPPAGADHFHMEFKDTVGGVWVEERQARTDLSQSGDVADPYSFKLDFTDARPPFDFTVDFAREGQGPRQGRFWWEKKGQRLGNITESS